MLLELWTRAREQVEVGTHSLSVACQEAEIRGAETTRIRWELGNSWMVALGRREHDTSLGDARTNLSLSQETLCTIRRPVGISTFLLLTDV